MEDARPVFVYVDTLHLLAIDISAEMRTAVYDKDTLARPACAVSDGGSEQACAHYEIIVWFHEYDFNWLLFSLSE